jgi:threonyl-tRNA synthetase
MREVLFPAGYVEVKTPLDLQQGAVGASGPLGSTTGEHVPHRIRRRDDELKPMNCPGHFLTYASRTHSYRDLPVRYHEQTPLHRNEASGVLVGTDARAPVLAGRCALLRHAEQIGERSSG